MFLQIKNLLCHFFICSQTMFLRVEQKWMPSPFLAREREAKPKGQEHEGRRAQKSESAECERKKV
jgi:hypothetical protein